MQVGDTQDVANIGRMYYVSYAVTGGTLTTGGKVYQLSYGTLTIAIPYNLTYREWTVKAVLSCFRHMFEPLVLSTSADVVLHLGFDILCRTHNATVEGSIVYVNITPRFGLDDPYMSFEVELKGSGPLRDWVGPTAAAMTVIDVKGGE